MPDYISAIIFVGGCSVFAASLLYAREYFLLKKQTKSFSERIATEHVFLSVSEEAQTYLRLGDKLAREGKSEESRTLYRLALEAEPSLAVSVADNSWDQPIKVSRERLEYFFQYMAAPR